jgi:hypothetical protein
MNYCRTYAICGELGTPGKSMSRVRSFPRNGKEASNYLRRWEIDFRLKMAFGSSYEA